jgi:uncharacterized membrane protein
MVTTLFAGALAVVVVGALFWLRRPAPAALGRWAWRAAQATGGLLLLSVAVYQKPQSFYTNFVILPSMVLFLVALTTAVVALVLGLAATIRGDADRRGLKAIAAALVAIVAAFLVILWRAS